MMTTETLVSLLGWCSLLNIGMLAFASIMIVVGGKSIRAIHARMFPLDDRDLVQAYFQYLAQYKMLTLIFNLIPYIALRIMGV